MQVLVISHLDGRRDRLAAVLDRMRAADADVEAIFVLGNLVPSAARRQAYQVQVKTGRIPAELNATLDREDTAAAQTYGQIFELLGNQPASVYLIPGEQDASLPLLGRILQASPYAGHIKLVHRQVAPLDRMGVVLGFGGRLTRQSDTRTLLHYPASEAQAFFDHAAKLSTSYQHAQRRIFLFATPPCGEQVDRLPNDQHCGVALINTIIQAHQPQFACCAGPAQGRGIEMLDGTLIVNPGSLAEGSYAMIDIDLVSIRMLDLDERTGADVPTHVVLDTIHPTFA